jgi:hypothetical protein
VRAENFALCLYTAGRNLLQRGVLRKLSAFARPSSNSVEMHLPSSERHREDSAGGTLVHSTVRITYAQYVIVGFA